MEGSSGPTAASTTIEFGGETLVLDPLTYADFGLIENHLIQQRPNPIDLAAQATEGVHERAHAKAAKIVSDAELRSAGLPKDAADEVVAKARLEADLVFQRAHKLSRDIMERAYEEARKTTRVNYAELMAWMDSPPGLAFTTWVAMEKRYPGKFTLDKAGDIVLEMGIRERKRLMDARDKASGLGELGNSTGGSNTPERTPTTTSSGISESDLSHPKNQNPSTIENSSRTC